VAVVQVVAKEAGRSVAAVEPLLLVAVVAVVLTVLLEPVDLEW
jgi:hypothetical protein